MAVYKSKSTSGERILFQGLNAIFQKMHKNKILRQLLPKGSISKVPVQVLKHFMCGGKSLFSHYFRRNQPTRCAQCLFSKRGAIRNHYKLPLHLKFILILPLDQVFDDVAVELTMALLQFFNGNPNEEQLFACMKALARFTQISGQEVPQLIQMIGPEPNKFCGTSQRVDQLIDQINQKLR